MFLKLVRRDHVTHYGLWWIPLAAPIGVILAAFGREGIVPRADGDYVGPVLLVWLIVTFMLGFAQLGQRADHLKMSLPLAARTVWLARLTAIIAFFLVMTGVAVVFMVAFNDREHQPLIHRDAVAFLFTLLSVMLLGMALIQNLWPTLQDIRVKRRWAAYSIGVWALCLALLFVLIAAAPTWSIVPLTAAVALFVRVWRKLPAAFTGAAAPRDDGGAAAGARSYHVSSTVAALAEVPVVSPDSLTHARWRRLMRKTIVQSLYHPLPIAALVAAFLVFLGFYVSGFYPEPLSGPVYTFWVMGLSTAFIVWPAKNVFRLDHLPLSRRRIFPYLALPAIGLVILGFVGGTIGGNAFSPRPPLREYLGTRECSFYTRVPDRFLEVAWDGEAPAITAPWGETHEPWTCRPVRGRTALMYAPYSLPSGSSREFVAWQTSREMADIYGVAVAPETIVARFDRYYERRDDGAWVLTSWGDPLRADFPGLRLQDWARPMAAIVLFLGVTWLLMAAWIIHAFFSGASPALFSLLGRFLPPVLPIVFVAVMIWLGEYGYTSSWKLTAMANVLVRRVADALPRNPVALWSVVAVVLAAFYFLAEAAFRRAQSTARGDIK
jgi:hypothetical protein